jgi:hypothetical protein
MIIRREKRMDISNVVDLESKRKLIALKKTEAGFKSYLSSLKQDQLQTEANYLLNQFSDEYNEEYILKSALLMDELAKRVSASNMSHTINKYAENLRGKLETSDEVH